MEHRLKCWPEYYRDVLEGLKNFELRKDDRPFEDGDCVILEEFEPRTKSFTGRQIHKRIAKVYRNLKAFGLKPGYCILSLERF